MGSKKLQENLDCIEICVYFASDNIDKIERVFA